MVKAGEVNPFKTDITADEMLQQNDKDKNEPESKHGFRWIFTTKNYLEKECPINSDTLYGTLPLLGLASSFITTGVILQMIQNDYYHRGDMLMVWLIFSLLIICGLQLKWAFNAGKNEQLLLCWLISKVLEFVASLSGAIVSRGSSVVSVCIVQLFFILLLIGIGANKYATIKKRNANTNVV